MFLKIFFARVCACARARVPSNFIRDITSSLRNLTIGVVRDPLMSTTANILCLFSYFTRLYINFHPRTIIIDEPSASFLPSRRDVSVAVKVKPKISLPDRKRHGADVALCMYILYTFICRYSRSYIV